MTTRRDALHDPEARLPDFVYRLRRMGYPGNVRVEFPVYTREDVRWIATIVHDLSDKLIGVASNNKAPQLTQVLEARGLIVAADRQIKLRTSHQIVKNKHRNI